MILICEALRKVLLACLLLQVPVAMAEPLLETGPGASSFEPDLLIVQVKFSGLQRTNQAWLESYLGLSLPERLSRPDIIRLQRKLMTTGVFNDVKVAVEPTSDRLDTFSLWLQVDEKWTTIPVIRGVYGGGTPLTIVGLYDIHSFGRLLTLGGEMRKYGEAPPGFVLFARDPRNQGGRNYFGAEFWRDFRRRQIFDSDGEVIGDLGTDTILARLKMHTPFSRDQSSRAQFAWRYGLELETLREQPSVFEVNPEYIGNGGTSENLGSLSGFKKQHRLLTTIVYDDVDINQIEMDGFRGKLRLGPNISEGKNYSLAEFEAFHFWMAPVDINVASHLFLGQSTFNSTSTQYYLGGFDSVRGLPDGIAYGTRSGYINLELRKIALRKKYVWLQPAVFFDAGNAGSEWAELAENIRSSVGAGLRIAVPQVYRLFFRLDYAVSTDGSGASGITAGMNHFFDPYRPL